jgi:hypothetical protein
LAQPARHDTTISAGSASREDERVEAEDLAMPVLARKGDRLGEAEERITMRATSALPYDPERASMTAPCCARSSGALPAAVRR